MQKSRINNSLNIGIVKYLNSKPLIQGLHNFLPDACLQFGYPSQLSNDLTNKLLDVALVSSIELFKNPEYEIVSDACIASDGPVLSVKLYSRVNLNNISSLALDSASVTSSALVRILLMECFGITPEIEVFPMHQTFENSKSDAFLVIGDRALLPPQEDFHACIDLGELWSQLTGTPFVYACWISRKKQCPDQVVEALNKCRDSGVENLEEIVNRESSSLSIDPELALTYLKNHISYKLGDEEVKGLMLFKELASQYGFLDKNQENHSLSQNPECII